MNICDNDFCWLCSVPYSCCDCELSGSAWSNTPSQESCTFDGHEKPADFDTDGLAFRTIDTDYYLETLDGSLNLDMADTIQHPEFGPQRPCAESTLDNGDFDFAEKQDSPGTMPPPDSSSPVDCLSYPMHPTLPMPRRGDATADGFPICRSRDDEQSRVEVPQNDRVLATTSASSLSPRPSTPKFLVQWPPSAHSDADTNPHSQDPRGCNSLGFRGGVTQGSFDERSRSAADDIPTDVQNICATRALTPAIERTNDHGVPDRTYSGSVPGNQKLVSASPSITESDGTHDAANSEGDESDDASSETRTPSRKPSIILDSSMARGTFDTHLKRRRSSTHCSPSLDLKRAKLDRFAPHVSRGSDSRPEPKYQATEPASIRRAQSLKSEISACSEAESTDSLFYPSPLSPPTYRPCLEEDCPPTLPSTPLPNSIEYVRSKANPVARTMAIYRRKSVLAIPPVPIIAPPARTACTLVRCAEDEAIDRLRALLLRERSERTRDGLDVHDGKRAERLKVTRASDPAFSRRDSASTSDSSDDRHQWEDQTTESQGSQDSAPSVKVFSGHRVVSREFWSDAFGIPDDLRKEATRWILKKLPKDPMRRERSYGDGRYRGIDLYDQLTSSRQTRFHAAQLFQRYFLLPEKVCFWKEAYKYERMERKFLGLDGDTSIESGVWDLAVACMGLGVKLHRDCLPPLGPVYAAEFLEMAPHLMTHETFELAQRDIIYSFQFLLGSCTPQDVMDELWNALPTLRKATAPMRDGWAVVQRVTWDKLYESLLEPDMLQYPVTLLTAAALVDGVVFALARHYKTEAEADVCKCNDPLGIAASERVLDHVERTSWQIYLFEANKLVDDVILDIRDVLQLSEMELDECRTWLSYVEQK